MGFGLHEQQLKFFCVISNAVSETNEGLRSKD